MTDNSAAIVAAITAEIHALVAHLVTVRTAIDLLVEHATAIAGIPEISDQALTQGVLQAAVLLGPTEVVAP